MIDATLRCRVTDRRADVLLARLHRRHGVLGLHLDPDVELVGRLAVPRLEQLEVADEAAGRAIRQLARLVGVAHLVIEHRRLGHEVELLADAHLLDREAAGPDDEQVVPPVGVATRLTDLGKGADRGEGDRPLADLSPIADQDDTERQRGVDAVPDELAVALLEDVKRKGDARAENGVKRKEGKLDGVNPAKYGRRRDWRQSRGNRKRRRLPGGVSLVVETPDLVGAALRRARVIGCPEAGAAAAGRDGVGIVHGEARAH